MSIRGTPKDINKYVLVDSELSIKLHSNSFIPSYIDENGIYFIKSKELIEFMERGWN